MKKTIPLFLFLTFISSFVSAISCEPQQIIKFTDGGQDCMSSYSFFKQTYNKQKSELITFANENKKIAIAVAKDLKACPLSVITWAANETRALVVYSLNNSKKISFFYRVNW